jgi:two-component system, chemotaxis family, sensor kinase CheA
VQEADLSILLGEFIEDARGHLDDVEQVLLLLERGVRQGCADSTLITRMLGSLHTCKGNAGMMGLRPLQSLLHELEGVLKLGAAGGLALDDALTGAVLSTLNALRGALSRLEEDPRSPLELDAEQMLLQYLQQAEPAAPRPAPLPARVEDYEVLAQKSDTVKVNFAKLDELLDLVGELVIQRTALCSLQERLKGEVKDRELLSLLAETGEQIGRSVGELRESIMKARMLPAASVFRRFSRLVRDLSLSQGKEITLLLEGEETELDKTVIDEIGEPLLHLVRNAVDHGMESAAERRAAGKPAAGTVTIGAVHEKNQVVIYVKDDGRGLDPADLRAQAVAAGLLDAPRAPQLSRLESLALIFLPGFSTAKRLTETSGRGIGLDVVQKNVQSLGGTIEIETEPGKGSSFLIKLPLTLAIIQALLVEVSGSVFAVPLSGVLESLAAAELELHRVSQGELCRLRDRLLPVKRLDRLFSLPAAGDDGYVVVVESGERQGALLVDRLLGQQEIVVKGLDDYLGDLPGISGATLLGDGTVALIMDLPSLLATGVAGGSFER